MCFYMAICAFVAKEMQDYVLFIFNIHIFGLFTSLNSVEPVCQRHRHVIIVAPFQFSQKKENLQFAFSFHSLTDTR